MVLAWLMRSTMVQMTWHSNLFSLHPYTELFAFSTFSMWFPTFQKFSMHVLIKNFNILSYVIHLLWVMSGINSKTSSLNVQVGPSAFYSVFLDSLYPIMTPALLHWNYQCMDQFFFFSLIIAPKGKELCLLFNCYIPDT